MKNDLTGARKYVLWAWFIALLIFPIALWLLPADYFDEGVSICPSQFLFSLECFGCGITRAINHFHHFEFEDAVYYNKFVLFFYPFLVYLWFRWTLWSARRLGLIKGKQTVAN